MQLEVRIEEWPLRQPFRISGNEWTACECVVAELRDGGHVGRGEAMGVSYFGETAASIEAAIAAVADDVRAGIDHAALQSLLPAGGARNALDCALWDLEAKKTGRTIWDLVGIDPRPVTTVFTIGLEDSPAAMARKAAAASRYPVLKIKLDADRPVERLAAIRAARPDAKLVVDANQGWSAGLLRDILPACAEIGLDMLEQPLPRGADGALDGIDSPLLLAADESCQDRSEVAACEGRYGMINIKLDKTGGLSEALLLATEARRRGFRLMVGNMLGTSLAMAPAFVIAQLCDFVDIDGPLLLGGDRNGAMRFDGATVLPFDAALWG